MDIRANEDGSHDEHVSSKLDRVLEKLEKIDVWKDETDIASTDLVLTWHGRRNLR